MLNSPCLYQFVKIKSKKNVLTYTRIKYIIHTYPTYTEKKHWLTYTKVSVSFAITIDGQSVAVEKHVPFIKKKKKKKKTVDTQSCTYYLRKKKKMNI